MPTERKPLWEKLRDNWEILVLLVGGSFAIVGFAGDAYIRDIAEEVVAESPAPEEVIQVVQTAKDNKEAIARVENKVDQLLLILTHDNGGR